MYRLLNNNEENVPCFKLINDCWEKVFDHLSPFDITQFGNSCKHFVPIAGEYLKIFCPQTPFYFHRGEIYGAPNQRGIINETFYKYIGKLCVSGDQFEELARFNFNEAKKKTFETLTSLLFRGALMFQINSDWFDFVLQNIETIELDCCSITSPTIFGAIATSATNLKNLSVKSSRNGFSLFSYEYEKLECLSFNNIYFDPPVISNLQSFLEKHKLLKRFNADYETVSLNYNILKTSNIQLDILGVYFNATLLTHATLRPFINKLIALKELGVFQHLATFLNSIDGDLQLLLVKELFATLAAVVPITELYANEFFLPNQYLASFLAFHFKDLEHLHVRFVKNCLDILPFVYNCKKLKSIDLHEILNDYDSNIHELNDIRTQKKDSGKIDFSVENSTDWLNHTRLRNVDLGKIKIARFERRRI